PNAERIKAFCAKPCAVSSRLEYVVRAISANRCITAAASSCALTLTRTRLVISDHESAYWASARTLKAAARLVATGLMADARALIDRAARSLSRVTSERDLLLDLEARSSCPDADSAFFALSASRPSEEEARSMLSIPSTRKPRAAASTTYYLSDQNIGPLQPQDTPCPWS